MKSIRQSLILLAALAFMGGMTGCSVFEKKEKEEDDGLSRWDDKQEKPGRLERWAKWEHNESQRLWRKYRDG